ncbi:hypothetical protein KSP39_PZI008175 [Platanthera zijinensis]|uniref:Uncharacterized protein n=1 Tax=Platanthera zijinensis TaxID=2320716 RepID=A0AAP0G8S1_9ASPA
MVTSWTCRGPSLAGEGATTSPLKFSGGDTAGDQSSSGARELKFYVQLLPAAGGGGRPPNNRCERRLPSANRPEAAARRPDSRTAVARALELSATAPYNRLWILSLRSNSRDYQGNGRPFPQQIDFRSTVGPLFKSSRPT